MSVLSAFPPLLLVARGGGLGASLRYLVGQWTAANLGPGFPFGTWAVNIIGGLAMGLLVAVLARAAEAEPLRLLLGVGVLGGFTTFSAFSSELVTMLHRGQAMLALGYAAASLIAGMAAVIIGLVAAQSIQ